jgi:hypothetical protein
VEVIVVDTLHAVVLGVIGNSMVSYIIEFFVALAVVTLLVRGAVLAWDSIRTSWYVLNTDVKIAKAEGTSVLGVWKERIRSFSKPSRHHG